MGDADGNNTIEFGEQPENGADLLDQVQAFITQYVAFPAHAAVAATLWAGHAHGLDYFESTPRIGFLAPEKACGKSRALEVLALLVPNPMDAVNCTPAALFRSVVDHPTILYDEIDTVFGPKAKDNEEVRGLLNAGHRRTGKAWRCVGEGTKQKVVAFPAYCAVAFAGIGLLPDTLMSRTIGIAMRRRLPDEKVEPFRIREAEEPGHELRDRLANWMTTSEGALNGAWPDMPEGVSDRDADVWESLLAVADAAAGHWPQTARDACEALVKAAKGNGVESLGVRLLRDLYAVFEAADQPDGMWTESVLTKLCDLDESPWRTLKKDNSPIDARYLANLLRPYDVRSGGVRIGEHVLKGYSRLDLWDSWRRYLDLASPSDKSDTSDTSDT
jgi:hypothetical protein